MTLVCTLRYTAMRLRVEHERGKWESKGKRMKKTHRGKEERRREERRKGTGQVFLRKEMQKEQKTGGKRKGSEREGLVT